MKQKLKRLAGILLSLPLLLGLMSGVSLPAYADDIPDPSVTSYNLWIGGDEVTSKNFNGNGWSYDHTTHTLTLSGYTYKGQGYVYNASEAGAAIYYNGKDDLTVALNGENHITPSGTQLGDCGIVSDNASCMLTFSGSGSLLIDSVGGFKYYNSAVFSRGTVIFSDGSFKLGNNDADYGVRVDSGSFVVIEDGIVSFEAAGYLAAINGPVRNAVKGTGYDAFKEKAGRVETSSTGATLTYLSGLQTKSYQVATFPVGQYTVVFNPGDGSGNMDPMTINEGETLTLPACTFTPPKDANKNDKTFNWWEVSGVDGLFVSGNNVLIVNNCAWDNVVTVTAKWKEKTDAMIVMDAEGQELNYFGEAQELLSQKGIPYGGKMAYAFGEDSVTAPTDGWSADLPKKTDAGTYYVWYKVAGDEEHFDSVAKCATAKINQAAAQTIQDVKAELFYTATSVSVSVAGQMPIDAGNLTYTAGDASKTGSVTVSDFTVDTNGNISAAISGGAVGDTVTLPVTIGSTNYADTTVNAVITLTPKEEAGMTITGTPAEAKTYGDADFMLMGSVTNAGTGTGVWTWESSDPTVLQITSDEANATVRILKVGSAAITAKYESDTTIDTKTTEAITINKATVTITAKDQSICVGDTIPDLSSPVLGTHYTVSGLVGEDTLTQFPALCYVDGSDNEIVFSSRTADSSMVGTCYIRPYGAYANDNYTTSYKKGTLTISEKLPITVMKAPTPRMLTYTGSDQKLVNEGTAEGGKMYYALGDVNGATGEYTTSIPTATAAGTYYIWYKVIGDKNHEDTDPKYVTSKIATAKVKILAAQGIAKGTTSLKLSWNKVSGAASYEIWMTKCGGSYKKVKTLKASKTNFTKTKLKKNTGYKFYVIAKDASGKKLCKSEAGHAITGNVRGKYTNAKSLKLSKAKVTLAKGAKTKIKATQTKAVKGKKLFDHTPLLRYTSDNKAVAAVDSKGNIKGAGKGTCRIYVQTVNGICKTVTVTVR